MSFQFNLSSPPIIVFLKISFDSLNRFLNFFLYTFLNSTDSLCSTFHLLQPFLFHFNFHINFFLLHFHHSPIPSKLSMTKKVQYSLSLCLSLSWWILKYFFNHFFFFNFSTNDSFCYCSFNCHILFVYVFGIFISNFMNILVLWYSNYRSQILFLYPIGLIWFGLIVSCFAG